MNEQTLKEKAKILSIYVLCQLKNLSSKVKYVVDHCIPLNNPLVCGLHTSQNLQIISNTKNNLKGNKFTSYTEKSGRKTVIQSSGESFCPKNYHKPPRKYNQTKKSQVKLAKKQVKNNQNKVKTRQNKLKTSQIRLKTS